MKRYVLKSVDTRQFVQDLLAIGAQGGTLSDNGVVHKGIMMMAEIDVPQEGIVITSPTMFLTASSRADQVRQLEELKDGALNVVPDDVASSSKEAAKADPKEVSKDSDKGFSKEELMEMSMGEVRKLTGLSGRSKEAIVDEWLASEGT